MTTQGGTCICTRFHALRFVAIQRRLRTLGRNYRTGEHTINSGALGLCCYTQWYYYTLSTAITTALALD